jgi:hypothetical protein
VVLCVCVCVCVCVHTCARTRCFIKDLENLQNYILWWRKCENEIRARTLCGTMLKEKVWSAKTPLRILLCPPQTPYVLGRSPPYTRGMVGIAGSLLTPVAAIGCGLADRRIVFQFPAGSIHSHALQGAHNCFFGTTSVVFNACGGSFRAASVVWSEKRTSVNWRGQVSLALYLLSPPASDSNDQNVAPGSFNSYIYNNF